MSKRVNVTLEESLYARLEALAKKRYISPATLAAQLVGEGLDSAEAKKS